MGVAGQDDVDPFDLRGHLAVDVEAVMGQDDNQIGPGVTDLLHDLGHAFLTHAEGEVGEHPFRIGDRKVGEGLADHGDRRAADLEHLVGIVGGFVPFGVEDIGAKEGEGQGFHDLGHAVDAQREFPVRGHRIGFQRVHHVDHVLPVGPMRGERALPGIAAIQQQRVGACGADRVDDGRAAVQPAHAAIGLRKRHEILIGQGIGLGRAGRDIEHLQEIRPGHMRRLALRRADAQVDLGFAEPDRL